MLQASHYRDDVFEGIVGCKPPQGLYGCGVSLLTSTNHLPGFGVLEMIDLVQGLINGLLGAVVKAFQLVTGSI